MVRTWYMGNAPAALRLGTRRPEAQARKMSDTSEDMRKLEDELGDLDEPTEAQEPQEQEQEVRRMRLMVVQTLDCPQQTGSRNFLDNH
jgi:hypothetical protein